ncbi:hypothetical protein BaRGS_00017324, partial [Batillaria attramentaria]
VRRVASVYAPLIWLSVSEDAHIRVGGCRSRHGWFPTVNITIDTLANQWRRVPDRPRAGTVSNFNPSADNRCGMPTGSQYLVPGATHCAPLYAPPRNAFSSPLLSYHYHLYLACLPGMMREVCTQLVLGNPCPQLVLAGPVCWTREPC